MTRLLIETSANGIELLAVLIIVVAILHGTIKYLVHRISAADGYEAYKIQVGQALLLGLELLVAADIIRTITLEPTMTNVLMLGVLVLVRTFLGWSLVVEMEGRWPWQGPR